MYLLITGITILRISHICTMRIRKNGVLAAYDLTYSSTYYGEHTTTVDGNGSDPGMKELIKVGTKAGMSRNKCRELAE